jgi:hypothetical protein
MSVIGQDFKKNAAVAASYRRLVDVAVQLGGVDRLGPAARAELDAIVQRYGLYAALDSDIRALSFQASRVPAVAEAKKALAKHRAAAAIDKDMADQKQALEAILIGAMLTLGRLHDEQGRRAEAEAVVRRAETALQQAGAGNNLSEPYLGRLVDPSNPGKNAYTGDGAGLPGSTQL